jgi:hypothetical protein
VLPFAGIENYLLLFTVFCCCLLPVAAICCFFLLSLSICCYLLLPTVACCYLLLFAFYVLPFAATYCPLLLFAVISRCLLPFVPI